MRVFSRKWLRLWLPVLALVAALLYAWLPGTPSYERTVQETFDALRSHRADKKAQVLRFLDEQREIAHATVKDARFQGLYGQTLEAFARGGFGQGGFAALERDWEQYFVAHLGVFYDLLLVNNAGDIFYTIRQEEDFQRNINAPMFRGLALSEGLKQMDGETRFIDYEFYSVSNEPASFYLIPVHVGGQRVGTAVFQLSLNRIIRIFNDRKGLGSTGEVYLVNGKGKMVTESRFHHEAASLTLPVNTRAVREAGLNGSGQGVLKDYRGIRVLSSYESFHYGGTNWVIIAEQDEGEVLTRFYRQWEPALLERALAPLAALPLDGDAPTPEADAQADLVNLQEYGRATPGNRLTTVGVSTCTAFSARMPGQTAYLAHLTPTDSAYDIGWPESDALGLAYTDLVEDVTGRMFWFDVFPSQRTQLEYGIYATTPRALATLIRKLLERQVLLHQIRVVYKPEFDTISVALGTEAGDTRVTLRDYAQGREVHGGVRHIPTLDIVIARLVGARS